MMHTGKPLYDFERILEWSEAIKLMSELSDEHHTSYLTHKVENIQDKKVQRYLRMHGMDFGIILSWLNTLCSMQRTDPHVPIDCKLKEHTLMQFDETWQTHILSENCSSKLNELVQQLKEVQNDAKEKMKLFYTENSDAYSSYSDYSNSTTDSDLEEAEDDLEEKEKRKDDDDDDDDDDDADDDEYNDDDDDDDTSSDDTGRNSERASKTSSSHSDSED
jgi:hypothetical protein